MTVSGITKLKQQAAHSYYPVPGMPHHSTPPIHPPTSQPGVTSHFLYQHHKDAIRRIPVDSSHEGCGETEEGRLIGTPEHHPLKPKENQFDFKRLQAASAYIRQLTQDKTSRFHPSTPTIISKLG